MTREQAIFFETMEDLNFEGYTEILILAYHEFICGVDFSKLNDVEVHSRAKKFLKQYQQLWYSDVDLYDLRWDILEQLDLNEAEWEYLDLKNEQEEFE